MIVLQQMSVSVKSVRDHDSTLRQVDRPNLTFKESYVPQHLANRIDDMGYIEVACRYFVKHWREQEEIFLTDQCDFESGITAFLELKRRVETTETTAEDEDTSFCHGYLNIARRDFPLLFQRREPAIENGRFRPGSI
jgi:hypothetical protein